MKVVVACEPKLWGIFQCIGCSSILEVDERDKIVVSHMAAKYDGFECPLCKKINRSGEFINVDLLLKMRTVKDEITSEQIIVKATSTIKRHERFDVYYADLLIGEIFCGYQNRWSDSTNNYIGVKFAGIYYNKVKIFELDVTSDNYIDEAKEIYINKIKEPNPNLDKYAELVLQK